MHAAWPDLENQIRLIEVFEAYRALADADRIVQTRAAALVTHVGAVGQVVRPELSREQLVEEGCFVRSSTRRIENRLVRRIDRLQVHGNPPVRVLPGHGPVGIAAGVLEQRLDEPALGFEPAIRTGEQFRSRAGFEEARLKPLLRGLMRHVLRAVLAELGEGTPLGIGPGTAWTIEAARLVQVTENPQASSNAHLTSRVYK